MADYRAIAAGLMDALTFTGSTEVGRYFLEYAAQSNMKEVCLEMGRKSAAVVLEDAKDIAAIAEIQANAIFWNMGENCAANSRIIAHKSVYDELVVEMGKQARTWVVGDPLDPDTQNGPLVSAEQMSKASGFGGRDNGIHAHEQYTELKTIWIDLSA